MLVHIISFDMSNIKITQLIKYKENLILNMPSKRSLFPQECMVNKYLFKSKSTQSYSIEI